jgi:hypothetical protein
MNEKKIAGALLAATVLLLYSSVPVYAASGRAGGHSGGGHPSGGRSSGGHPSGWHSGGGHPSGGHHGSGGHVVFSTGFFVGPGYWWGSPYWWGAPYPYYPYYYPYYGTAPTVIQQAPSVYIQPEPQQPSYWYYCQNPQGYYPYVQQCPGGWMTVVPPTAPPAQPAQ